MQIKRDGKLFNIVNGFEVVRTFKSLEGAMRYLGTDVPEEGNVTLFGDYIPQHRGKGYQVGTCFEESISKDEKMMLAEIKKDYKKVKRKFCIEMRWKEQCERYRQERLESGCIY